MRSKRTCSVPSASTMLSRAIKASAGARLANADALFPNNDCARDTTAFADTSAAFAAAENESAQQIAAPRTWNCMTTLSRKRAMQRPTAPRQPVADGTSGAGSYACTVTNWTVVKITDVLRSVRPATFRCGAHRRGAADAWCYWPLRPSMRAMHRF
ncbi:exported hypothetical protein [Xanthomonas citri pv. fuscans]|nr:exported hypothetical protein [Xanthomonas citri pv. fuscans]